MYYVDQAHEWDIGYINGGAEGRSVFTVEYETKIDTQATANFKSFKLDKKASQTLLVCNLHSHNWKIFDPVVRTDPFGVWLWLEWIGLPNVSHITIGNRQLTIVLAAERA